MQMKLDDEKTNEGGTGKALKRDISEISNS